jgi:hypothetical protein
MPNQPHNPGYRQVRPCHLCGRSCKSSNSPPVCMACWRELEQPFQREGTAFAHALAYRRCRVDLYRLRAEQGLPLFGAIDSPVTLEESSHADH